MHLTAAGKFLIELPAAFMVPLMRELGEQLNHLQVAARAAAATYCSFYPVATLSQAFYSHRYSACYASWHFERHGLAICGCMHIY